MNSVTALHDSENNPTTAIKLPFWLYKKLENIRTLFGSSIKSSITA